MTAPHILDPAGLLGEALCEASPDMMRHLLQTMINTLLSADADAVIGTEWGKPTPGRATQRNPHRAHQQPTWMNGGTPLNTSRRTRPVSVPMTGRHTAHAPSGLVTGLRRPPSAQLRYTPT
ncbi:hypothetical protein GCM10009746_30910 [Microbacterium paludicola]|jgi:hypothetical protein